MFFPLGKLPDISKDISDMSKPKFSEQTVLYYHEALLGCLMWTKPMWAKRRAWAWPGRYWCWLSDHNVISIAITWPGFQAANQKPTNIIPVGAFPPTPTFFSLAFSNDKLNPVFWWFHKCFHSSPKSSVAWVCGKFSKKSHVETRRAEEIHGQRLFCDKTAVMIDATNEQLLIMTNLLTCSYSGTLFPVFCCISPPTFPHSIFLRSQHWLKISKISTYLLFFFFSVPHFYLVSLFWCFL